MSGGASPPSRICSPPRKTCFTRTGRGGSASCMPGRSGSRRPPSSAAHESTAARIVEGAPVKAIAPCEGTGYETGAISLIKGGKNADGARKFIDWALGAEAQILIGAGLKIYSIPSNTAARPHADAPQLAQVK